MTRTHVLEGIARLGLVPVIRAQSQEDAIRVIDAIREGGISVLEITMTVPGAVSVMKAVASRFGSDVIVGAGTVLDPDTASACLDAGAQFIVSPAVDLPTIERCRRQDVAVMPGALTPTEVVTAWRAGADVVKVFPCSAVGGASYLKALKAPLPQVALMPTGGVSLTTAADFITAGAFALGVGADLVDLAAIREGRAAQVTERAREYVRIVRDARATLPG